MIAERNLPALSPPVAPQGASALDRRDGHPAAWLYFFVCTQFACQLALLIPALSSLRVVNRTFAYCASLLLFFFLPGRSSGYGARTPAFVVLAIMLLEFMHPEGGGAVALLAQFGLYLAVLAPIFWVPRLRVSVQALERLVLLLWLFYSASSVVGVLQAYFPGHFQPPLSVIIARQGPDIVRSFEIELSSGERMLRPMGLTDVPGGAAGAGLYTMVLGLGIVQARKPFFGARVLAVGSMILGMMCLYLCQVRAVLVMTGICIASLVVLLVITGRVSRLLVSTLVTSGVVMIGLVLALEVAGASVLKRLESLIASDPASVYYSHRGYALDYTINEFLPKYPFGAGLGRWGMTASYFGSRAQSIWVEIQWTGWLLDGGLPLVIGYSLAIFATTWAAFRIARRRGSEESSELSVWGTVIVAYNIGAMALTFSYPIFVSSAGMEFWLLNAALWRAAQSAEPAI